MHHLTEPENQGNYCLVLRLSRVSTETTHCLGRYINGRRCAGPLTVPLITLTNIGIVHEVKKVCFFLLVYCIKCMFINRIVLQIKIPTLQESSHKTKTDEELLIT